MIPSIAFAVPDLEGNARLRLRAGDDGQDLACIESLVKNGKSMKLPSVSYVATGIAGGALAVSGLSALGAAGQPGGATASPGFVEVVGWFQSMAMNGMLSVSYPPVYKSFAENFAFSAGLIEWESLQTAIDNFRAATGGDLSSSSFAALKRAFLADNDEEGEKLAKRASGGLRLLARQLDTDEGSDSGSGEDDEASEVMDGIQAYVEQLMIPDTNTFMTVLLVFAIVIASITLGILLFKGILEGWALFGSFPKSLTGFRKRYWWFIAKTLTNLILLLYGVWTLYSVYQFTNGDSWAAKALAGVTLGIFTAILGFFTFKIWQHARRSKKMDGDSFALYDDKQTWVKYNIFYENYKKSYWWIFVPTIVYMFTKGCIIAGANGHGFVQAGGQLIVEALFLIALLWYRPYTLKSGNWINIIIQVVRVLSVVCILVFVEQLGVTQTTKTVTGVALVVTQSVLTGLLAILIAVNAIVMCCKDNPHRKKRKETGKDCFSPLSVHIFGPHSPLRKIANGLLIEKLRGEADTLTPLEPHNSLLMKPSLKSTATSYAYPVPPISDQANQPPNYVNFSFLKTKERPSLDRMSSRDGLIASAADMGRSDDDPSRPRTPSPDREPRLPDVGLELRELR